ncbi:DUF1499 domain-containing protein [Pyruvatibacter sp.]|uniref:DUF1499 domain-containing protein n=1 Tax=Pyruvatibacter sp. TaxID=1981328 RepID=UPI0032EDA176
MSDTARSRIATLALRLVGVGLIAAVSAVLLTRFGIISASGGVFGTAGSMLVVFLGMLLGLVGLVRAFTGKPGMVPSLVAVVAGAAILFVPVTTALSGGDVPMIHDITTDLEDPPQFVAVVALRGEGTNPIDRAAPDLANLQRGAYPHLQTLTVADDITTVFAAALAEAEASGWDIADAQEPENGEPGRIEATDTTLLFGFKDDVVIRIADDGPDRTLVDVRSVSRVGQSDLGANAARIDAFLAGLRQRLGN